MTNPFRPVISTQADAELAWKTLMQPLGFTSRSIWMLLIEADGRPIPQMTEIAEADVPDPRTFGGLTEALRMLRDELGVVRVAFLRSRPGRDGVGPKDREWASGLYRAAREAGLGAEVVHLANDVTIVPIPRDELSEAS